MSLSPKNPSINRRQFLKTGALTAGALFVSAAAPEQPGAPAQAHSIHIPMVVREAYNFNWYVDSHNGNDANAGNNPDAPLHSLGELQQRGIRRGDRIGLRRGSHWREQLTIPAGADDVLIEAYGEGEPPLLDCSDIQENSTFSSVDGYPDVYQKVIDVSYLPSEPSWMSVWEDNLRLVRAASLEECSSLPGSYFAINEYSPSCTVYIHASDSSAIDQNGRLYECSVRHAGVYGYFAYYTTLSGLHCRRNFCDGGSIKTGPFATLRDCTAEEGSKHSTYIRRGTNVYGCTFSRAYYSPSTSMLALNDDTPDGEDTTIENCVFEIDPGAPNAHLISPMNGHNNVSGYFGTVTLNDCVFKNFRGGGIFLGINHSAQIVLNNPQFLNCRAGIGAPLIGSAPPGCRLVINGGFWQSSVPNQRAINITLPMVPVVINDFTILPGANTDAGFILVTAASQVALIRCTLDISAASGLLHGIYANHPGAVIAVYGSCFRGNLLNSSWYYLPAYQALDSDFNTFEQTFRTVVAGVACNTLAEHQALTGEDLNSSFVP